MKICQVIEAKGSAEIFTVPPSMTLKEFVSQACKLHVGALLVKDEKGQLVGILSERDILRQIDLGTDFVRTTVGEVMTTSLVLASSEDDIHQAMDLMVNNKIRHLPVVSKGEIQGLITVRDLLYAMRKADEDEIRRLIDYLQSSTEETKA